MSFKQKVESRYVVKAMLSRLDRKALLEKAAKKPQEDMIHNGDDRLGMAVNTSFDTLKKLCKEGEFQNFSTDKELIEMLVENDYDLLPAE